MTDYDRAGDIPTLTNLKMDEDPRTITEMIEADTYEDVTVTEAHAPSEPGGHWSVQWGSTGSGFKFPDGEGEIKVGDTLRLYGGAHVGDEKHGWALNGELVEWKTPWERFADRVTWLAQYDRDKRERFEKTREDLDRRVGELPAPLKARIERFRREDPKFRVDSEAYEMSAVGDAPKIAQALAEKHGWNLTPDLTAADVSEEAVAAAVKEFYDLPYEEQQKVVPDLDQGHSGNTFGAATGLARALLAGQAV